jgi:hypothetical protein
MTMSFLDKVKEQATAAAASAAAAAKDAAEKGQSKLDEMQAKSAADAMLRDLGALSYASVTDREQPGGEAAATQLVAALQAHEAAHGSLDLTPTHPAGAGA